MNESKYKVVLLQLPAPRNNLEKLWGNIPLAAGYLKATAFAHGLLEEVEIEILQGDDTNISGDARLIELLVSKLPDIIGWSIYLWNSERSLYISKEIKKRLPHVKILVGGPEVTKETQYILNDPVVDIGCIGEGENTFIEVLYAMVRNDMELSDIPGIFYWESGACHITSDREYMRDINQIPSPFLLEYFDLKKYEIVLYETLRGCPNNCSYCQTATIPVRVFSSNRVLSDVEKIIKSGVTKIRFIESNLLIHPDFHEITKGLASLNPKRHITFNAFAYAEQFTEAKVQMLKKANFNYFEIGLQTIHNRTLKKIHRPALDKKKFIEGVRLLERYDISYEVDTIIGLPGETLEDYKKTKDWIKENNFKRYGAFPLMVMPGTKIRKEADQFGYCVQSHPPYYLQKSDYIDEDEIHEAKKDEHKNMEMNTAIHTRLSNHFDASFLSEGTPSNTQNNSMPEFVNKIVVENQATQIQELELSALAEFLRKKVCQPFTLWLKDKSGTGNFSCYKNFIKQLLNSNPFLLLNFILEFENDYSTDLFYWVDQEFKARERMLKGSKEGSPLKKYLILPSDACWEIAREKNDHDIMLVALFDIKEDWDWQKELDVAASDRFKQIRCLIRMSPKPSRNLLLEFFTHLLKIDANRIKFENIAYFYCFTLFANSNNLNDVTLIEPLSIESVVGIYQGLNLTPLLLPNDTTELAMVACQWQFRKWLLSAN